MDLQHPLARPSPQTEKREVRVRQTCCESGLGVGVGVSCISCYVKELLCTKFACVRCLSIGYALFGRPGGGRGPKRCAGGTIAATSRGGVFCTCSSCSCCCGGCGCCCRGGAGIFGGGGASVILGIVVRGASSRGGGRDSLPGTCSVFGGGAFLGSFSGRASLPDTSVFDLARVFDEVGESAASALMLGEPGALLSALFFAIYSNSLSCSANHFS